LLSPPRRRPSPRFKALTVISSRLSRDASVPALTPSSSAAPPAALGQLAGLNPEEIAACRHARAADPRREAGLVFAQAIVVNRGEVSDAAVNRVRAAGFSDGEITELVANVVINIFTNYVNHVAQTIVDFPRVELSLPAG
jgi:hypothetical protein